MPVPRLSRRFFLRGLGGVAIALPALEAMMPRRAFGQSVTAPLRFLMSYGGQSQSAEGSAELLAPNNTGHGYDLPKSLKPLSDLGVQDDISIVSGLKIPWDTGSGVPAGGRSVYYHYNTIGPMIAGTRTGSSRYGGPTGPTADQLVGAAIAGSTPFKVLGLRVQAVDYDSGTATTGSDLSMSWKGSPGSVTRVDPIFSPHQAFQTLFSNFTPTDPSAVLAAQRALAERKSVLDLVDWNTNRILPGLGSEDKTRIQRHYDEIRALETRIASIPTPMGSCAAPNDPGSDPSIGSGYSGEDTRANAMTDLIAMAFTCDLTRSVSFMLTQWKCYMNMNAIDSKNTDIHSMTHAPDANGVSDGLAWHVKQLARLTSKLKAIPDIDGNKVLDNCAMTLMFEGGRGYDPEGQNNNSPHSTENMCVLIAGRAGGLKSGQHVAATGKHPANVVISAMNAVGVSGGLGEVSGNIPELFT